MYELVGVCVCVCMYAYMQIMIGNVISVDIDVIITELIMFEQILSSIQEI